MREIDLHDFSVTEAMEFFIRVCKEEYKKNNTKIKIIHGYGSNGEGGKIKKCIRNYLKDNKEYFLTITGEEIDLNQGYTIITIKKSLQDMDSMLENEIMRFCELAKSNEKIVGKLRKYGEKNIQESIKKLLNKGKIKEVIKGKYRHYETNKMD